MSDITAWVVRFQWAPCLFISKYLAVVLFILLSIIQLTLELDDTVRMSSPEHENAVLNHW